MSFVQDRLNEMSIKRAPDVKYAALSPDSRIGHFIGIILFEKSSDDSERSAPGLDLVIASGEGEGDIVRIVEDVPDIDIGVTPGRDAVWVRVPEGTITPFPGNTLLLYPSGPVRVPQQDVELPLGLPPASSGRHSID